MPTSTGRRVVDWLHSSRVAVAVEAGQAATTTPTGKDLAAERAAAREANPALTVFDTGEMLEPALHRDGNGNPAGPVDFDNNEAHTVLTVFAHPGQLETDDDNTTVVTIDWEGPGKLRINLNDGEVATFDEDGARIVGSGHLEEAQAALAEWGALPSDGPPVMLRAKVGAARRVVRALRALLEGEAAK